jgi:hypothetical protein
MDGRPRVIQLNVLWRLKRKAKNSRGRGMAFLAYLDELQSAVEAIGHEAARRAVSRLGAVHRLKRNAFLLFLPRQLPLLYCLILRLQLMAIVYIKTLLFYNIN